LAALRVVTMKSSDLVSIATFRSPADAQTAKNILDVAGIDSVVRPDPSQAASNYSLAGAWPKNAVTQLLVSAEDVQRAGEALRRS